MSEIDGISNWFPPSPIQPKLSRPSLTNEAQANSATPLHSDKVEISNAALFLSKIASMPDIRPEKVEALRNAILQGNYYIDTLLQEALENFLDEYQI